MKNKLKYIIIVIVIVILTLIGVALAFFNKGSNLTSKDYNKIIEKINKKDSFSLYIYSEKEQFLETKQIDNVIDYYEKYYNLNVEKLSVESCSRKKINELMSLIGATGGEVSVYETPPGIFLIKKGIYYGGLYPILNENSLVENYLNSNKLIDKKYMDKELSGKEFLEKTSSSDKTIVIMGDLAEKSFIDLRSIMKEIQNKYKIDFMYMNIASIDNYDIMNEVNKIIKNDRIKWPVISIIGNKAILYDESNNKDKIIEFLKNNKVI